MSNTRRFYTNYSFDPTYSVTASNLIGTNTITTANLSVLNFTGGPSIISTGNISTKLVIPSDKVLRLRSGTDNNHTIQYNNTGFGNIAAGNDSGEVPTLIIKGYGGGLIGNTTSGPYLYWGSNSRVGINTTAPSSTLDLNNNDMIVNRFTIEGQLKFVTSGNNLITLYTSGNNRWGIGVSDTLDTIYQAGPSGSHTFYTATRSDTAINRSINETMRIGMTNGNKYITFGYKSSYENGLISAYGDDVHGDPVNIVNSGSTSPAFVQFNKWRVGIRGSSASLYPSSIFINNVDSNKNLYYTSNGNLLIGRVSSGNNLFSSEASISVSAGDNIGRGTLCLGSSSTSTNNWSIQSSNGSFYINNGSIESSPKKIMTLSTNGNTSLPITTGTLQSRYIMSHTGTFNITGAGTYNITLGNYLSANTGLARLYSGKLIVYIKPNTGTSFMWASQADVVAIGNASNLRGFVANTSYHTSGSGITATFQPFSGANSTTAVSDSPAFSYQINVSSYTTTSVVKWTMINFSNN